MSGRKWSVRLVRCNPDGTLVGIYIHLTAPVTIGRDSLRITQDSEKKRISRKQFTLKPSELNDSLVLLRIGKNVTCIDGQEARVGVPTPVHDGSIIEVVSGVFFKIAIQAPSWDVAAPVYSVSSRRTRATYSSFDIAAERKQARLYGDGSDLDVDDPDFITQKVEKATEDTGGLSTANIIPQGRSRRRKRTKIAQQSYAFSDESSSESELEYESDAYVEEPKSSADEPPESDDELIDGEEEGIERVEVVEAVKEELQDETSHPAAELLQPTPRPTLLPFLQGSSTSSGSAPGLPPLPGLSYGVPTPPALFDTSSAGRFTSFLQRHPKYDVPTSTSPQAGVPKLLISPIGLRSGFSQRRSLDALFAAAPESLLPSLLIVGFSGVIMHEAANRGLQHVVSADPLSYARSQAQHWLTPVVEKEDSESLVGVSYSVDDQVSTGHFIDEPRHRVIVVRPLGTSGDQQRDDRRLRLLYTEVFSLFAEIGQLDIPSLHLSQTMPDKKEPTKDIPADEMPTANELLPEFDLPFPSPHPSNLVDDFLRIRERGATDPRWFDKTVLLDICLENSDPDFHSHCEKHQFSELLRKREELKLLLQSFVIVIEDDLKVSDHHFVVLYGDNYLESVWELGSDMMTVPWCMHDVAQALVLYLSLQHNNLDPHSFYFGFTSVPRRRGVAMHVVSNDFMHCESIEDYNRFTSGFFVPVGQVDLDLVQRYCLDVHKNRRQWFPKLLQGLPVCHKCGEMLDDGDWADCLTHIVSCTGSGFPS